MPETDLETSFSALADDLAAGVSVPPVDRVRRRALRRTGNRVAGGLLTVALIGGAVGVVVTRGNDGPGATNAATKTASTSSPSITADATPLIPVAPNLVITEQEEGGADGHITWDLVAFHADTLTSKVALDIQADLNEMVQTGIAAFRATTAEPLAPGERPRSYTTKISQLPSLPGLLVVRASTSEDLGGAHPTPLTEVRTYDLMTGSRVGLTQLVTAGALGALQAEATDRLRAVAESSPTGIALDDGMLRDGTAPSAENYRAMWPAADGLHVVFGVYQVAAYAFGQPEIVIPWSVAGGWLPEGSPVRVP